MSIGAFRNRSWGKPAESSQPQEIHHASSNEAPHRPPVDEGSVEPRDRRKFMAKYVLLLGGADLDKRSGNSAFAKKIFEDFSAWLRSLRAGGHYVGSHKLRDQTGARLTVRGGQVVEGPFMETKEAVGGLFVVEAASLEEAVALARGCPTLTLQNGYVEVRLEEEVVIPAHG
jgi:hypothetical protein